MAKKSMAERMAEKAKALEEDQERKRQDARESLDERIAESRKTGTPSGARPF